MEILLPVLVLAVTALLCAVLLTVAAVFLSVKRDERAAAIRECLPGANCGACGFSGCDGYAAALSEGKTDATNLCVPGGDGAAREIAAVLGVEAQDVIEKVAVVACNGTCGAEVRKYEYEGPKTCKAANMAFSGDKVCAFACLGYGDCAAVCPQGAICIEGGVAHVDPRRCVGCGICARTCPNHIIHVINDVSRVVVKCSNHDKGVVVKRACEHGCLACGKCERVCESDAIHLVNNLPVIDYEKCIGCGKCREACPVGVIHSGDFTSGSHAND